MKQNPVNQSPSQKSSEKRHIWFTPVSKLLHLQKDLIKGRPLRLNAKRAVARPLTGTNNPLIEQQKQNKEEKTQKLINALRFKWSRANSRETTSNNKVVIKKEHVQAKPQPAVHAKLVVGIKPENIQLKQTIVTTPSHGRHKSDGEKAGMAPRANVVKAPEKLTEPYKAAINLTAIIKQSEVHNKKLKKTLEKNRLEELDRLKAFSNPANSKDTKCTPNSTKSSKNPPTPKPVAELVPKKPPLISGKSGDLSVYVIGRTIGQGAYASVRLAYHKSLCKKVALKVYEKKKLVEPQRQKSVYREIRLLEKMNHVNVVKLYDAFDTENHVLLAMDYVRGNSLHGYLKAQPNRRLDEWEAKRLFRQVICGIEYCHGKSIAHRDIKLENLLLDEHNNVKIIDFGFSTCIPNTKKIKIFCGTPSYMSPEIVLRKEYAGPPADIWALGVLLYAMLCGTFPFKGRNDKELYRRISAVQICFPEHLSELAKSLLQRIFQFDPDKRPNAHEIMNDPWLSTTSDKSYQKLPFKDTPKSSTSQNINLEAYMAYYSDQSFPARTDPYEAAKPIQTVNNNINIITNITHINLPPSNNSLTYNNSDYSISSSKMSSQNSLMKSNGGSIDNELLGSIVKLGYSIEDVKQQLQNENSHIYKLYNKLVGERRLLNMPIAPQTGASLGSSFDALKSKSRTGLMNTSGQKLSESDLLNQTAPLRETERSAAEIDMAKEV